MSKLIQMRRRIKAIETIKKVTHAMRLISMSAHSRLKSKQHALAEYVTAIETLFQKALHGSSAWTNPIIQPPPTSTKTLIIVVGSQKGLCGNFNNTLFARFNAHTNMGMHENIALIAVGKKATDELKKSAPHALVETYEHFTTSTFLAISHTLIKHITTQETPYAHVIMWSNVAKSFFIQKPLQTNLIPLTSGPHAFTSSGYQEEYREEYSAEEIINTLAMQCLEAHIERLLFESLLAEQAARFISMDGSTRNAQKLLDETRLQYNKIRQAKITKELTELIGSF
ncbi:MAG: F0F1 ATP synthase subunit gamma [Candidatus Dependentiae bacterium]|nr:F0F1 ATP synthase subunit gamma [Candidatus Dependentiae bacterium]